MTEPVSLAQAKAQCRASGTAEDDLISGYIKAAREWVERYTGHILVRRAIVESFDRFGCYIEISNRPIVSIDSIGYIDSAGTSQPFTDFTANVLRSPARVYPTGSWPTLGVNGYATLTYTAGDEAGDEPQPLLQAMLLLIGHWYTNREQVVVGVVPAEIQMGVEALCAPFRPVF